MFPLFRNSNRRYLFIFSVCISHQCTKFWDWRGGGGVEPRPRGQYPAEMSRGGWRVCTVYSVYCAVLCSTVLPGGSTVYTPTNFPDIFGHKLQSQLQLYTFVAPHRTQSRDWRYFTRFIWVKTRKRLDGPMRMGRIYNVSFWAVLCCMRASHVTTLCYVKV